jgi:hypothetical protein
MKGKKRSGHRTSSSYSGRDWNEPIPIGRLEVGSDPDIHDNYEIAHGVWAAHEFH